MNNIIFFIFFKVKVENLCARQVFLGRKKNDTYAPLPDEKFDTYGDLFYKLLSIFLRKYYCAK